ncbi:hypothetical protein ACTXT7_001335 [Hymenolepis weldensis]
MQSMVSGNNNNVQAVGSNPTSEIDFYQWVSNLNSVETREKALLELCRMRESLQNFAPLLWHSYGTVTALLQEITAVYPYINPPNLTAHQSNRVCNALALLQCLASHPLTRSEFLKAQIPLYLYQFLNTSSQSRPFEYLRLTSLGVIGALAKTDEPDAISFLLNSEIIPLCLQIMESGSELSKTVATFIMQKLLQDNTGLDYICQTYDRFSHVASILNAMVGQLVRERSIRLLKHVIRCYQRLADNPRMCISIHNTHCVQMKGFLELLMWNPPFVSESIVLLESFVARVFTDFTLNLAAVCETDARKKIKTYGIWKNTSRRVGRACEALSKCFPTAFVDGTFNDLLAEEPATQRSLTLLIEQMNRPQMSSANASGVVTSASADSADNAGQKLNANPNNDGGENMGDASSATAAAADNQ